MRLYEPVHDAFERFCKARVYGDMNFQDLMHDTILIAFDKFEQLKDSKAFLHFLFGISRRVLSNANKKNKPENYGETLPVAFGEDVSSKNDAAQTLYKALSYLPEEQREAVILFEITGFSIKEIAGIQNAGESAVKQRLHRGRQRLLNLLIEDQNFEKREVI